MRNTWMLALLTVGPALPCLAQAEPGDEVPEPPALLEEQLDIQLQLLLQQRQRELAAEAEDADDGAEPINALGLRIRGEAVTIKTHDDPLAERSRDEVLALLDDASFNKREQAEAHLLADDSLDRDALRSLMRKAESDEQRNRLLRIAEHHVMREVREELFSEEPPQPEPFDDQGRFQIARRASAAIGFSYVAMLADDNNPTNLPAVIVTATMPGFPGYAALRPGDLIVAINGQTARGIRHRELVTNWLSRRIGFHRPGDTLTLTIVRDNQAISLLIVCAQGRALEAMYTSRGLEASFRERPYTEKWLAARAELTAGLMPEPKVLRPLKPAE